MAYGNIRHLNVYALYPRIHEKYETVQEEILRLLHEKNKEYEKEQ